MQTNKNVCDTDAANDNDEGDHEMASLILPYITLTSPVTHQSRNSIDHLKIFV